MDTKPAAKPVVSKLAVLWLILVLVLAAGAGAAPGQVWAHEGSIPGGNAAELDPAGGDFQEGETTELQAASTFPDLPFYDSSWKTIAPGETLFLTHSLGSQGFTNPDAYVVDLRFLDTRTGLESQGMNQIAFGVNQLIAPVPTGYTVNDQAGAYWFGLNPDIIKVYRMPQDKAYAAKIRVRIWVVTQMGYDSGWRAISPGSSLPLTFNITGGAADNYLVYLEFHDLQSYHGVHQRYYGGFSQESLSPMNGAYWQNLTDNSITINRRADDDYVDEVRVRIWNVPTATYTSDWLNITAGNSLTILHQIGGNPDDAIVDLQFKDSGSLGVNQYCYGGCDFHAGESTFSNSKRGAYWHNLTSSSIKVTRGANDTFADQVRVRIWNIWKPVRPNYDSGWQTSSHGDAITTYHYVGANADDYLVNLIFDDTGFNVHQRYYGVKFFGDNPPFPYAANRNAGAFWENLTSSSIKIFCAGSDLNVDRWRLRIWKMPTPDYDSGWTAIDTYPGSHDFNHGLIGDNSDFLVDVSFNDTAQGGAGKNQVYFGGYVSSANAYYGAFWYNFTTTPAATNLTVFRFPDDLLADQVRVRIWRIAAPDFASGYVSIAPGADRFFSHNLRADPGLMLVDATARLWNGSSYSSHKMFYGRVDIGTGSPFLIYPENARVGFYWDNLTATGINFSRMGEDDRAETINARIWVLSRELYLPLMRR